MAETVEKAPGSEHFQTRWLELLGWVSVLLALFCAYELPLTQGAPGGYCATTLVAWRLTDYARRLK